MSRDFWMGATIGLGTGFIIGIIVIMAMGALLPSQ